MAIEIFKLGWLRKLFGLERPVKTEPAFPKNQDGLFNQFFGNAGSWYSSQTQLENQRRAMYIDYEAMDFYPPLSSALDVFASDSTQYDLSAGASIWAVSNNEKAAKIVNEMLQRVLEPNIFGIARSVAKYGDCFEQVLYSETRIEALSYVQPDLLTRVEDMWGRLMGFTPGVLEGPPYRALPGEKLPEPMSTPWDFIHFRIRGFDRGSVHGRSLLQPARRVWRQLKIIEDSMVIYRLNRGADRLVFYIDVGNLSREEQFRTMNAWRQFVRKSFFRDRRNGRFEQEYDPNTVDQDIYWPTRKDSQSRVDKLTGSPNVGDIGDVEYFRDILFSGIKIPKAYLGFEGDVNAKATLAQQDVRYARTLKTLTRALIEGAMRLSQIELVLNGIDPLDEKLILEIRMSPCSYLDELQRQELWSLRLELAQRMLELGTNMNFNMAKWAAHILYNYLDMSIEAIKTFLKPEGPQPQAGLGMPPAEDLGPPLEEPGLGEPGLGGEEPAEELPPPSGGAAGGQPPAGEFGLDVAGQKPRRGPSLNENRYGKKIRGKSRLVNECKVADAVLADRTPIDTAMMTELYKFVNGNRKLDMYMELDRELGDWNQIGTFREKGDMPKEKQASSKEHSEAFRSFVEKNRTRLGENFKMADERVKMQEAARDVAAVASGGSEDGEE